MLCYASREMVGRLESLVRGWASSPRGFARLAAGYLALLALAMYLGLGSDFAGRISETRCVMVMRHMVESGDWLVPHLGNEVRLQKPPLFYWASAVVAKVSGDLGPWSARAVSGAAALGVAALVLFWGRALGGGGVGLMAAASLSAMQQFTSSGRRGDAEMLLSLFSTAALFCFDRIHAGKRRELLPWLAVLLGLAFLTKATAVLFTVGAPIAAFLAWRRELRVVADRGALTALAVALAIGLSWYVALLAVVPGAFESLRDALFLPLGSSESHSGSSHFKPPWWYLSVLPIRAAPAGLLLPLVIWRFWTTRLYRDDPRRRFAALALLAPFVAFSLLPQKQKHYTLAMLPGLALCTADALEAGARELGLRFSLGLRALGPLFALAGVAVTLFLALYFLWVEELAPLAVAAGAVLPLALFALAVVAALTARPASFGASWIAGLLLALAVGRGIVEPRIDSLPRQFPGMTLGEREHLLGVARSHPWFAKIALNLNQVEDSSDD
jgi:4-amino-4-deoxy-L-arabinose transferase-like glycosyltransferase